MKQKKTAPVPRWGRVVRFDRLTGERLTVTPPDVRAFKPQVSRTGRWRSFVRYPRRGSATLRLRHLVDGSERDLIELPEAERTAQVVANGFIHDGETVARPWPERGAPPQVPMR